MTQTPPHSNSLDAVKPETDDQNLDALFTEGQDSEDDAFTIHTLESDDSLFDSGEEEADDTGSSLFGVVPETETTSTPEAKDESTAESPIADPWQNNLVAELQATATSDSAPGDDHGDKVGGIAPEYPPQVATTSPEVTEAKAPPVVPSTAPPALPKLELPTVQPLSSPPTSLPKVAPVSLPAQASAEAPGGGLSFRNKAVILALLIGLLPAGVIGVLNLNAVSQLTPQTEQQVLNNTKGKLQTQILIGLLLTAAGAGILAYWLAGESARSQSQLALRAKQFAQTSLDTPLTWSSQDEVAIAD
ncbi:MAG: hypothetical protein VKJ27_07940, partial [Synechocystis sp.]|nr:hypothetical protein [Synechocystis sp.]